LMRTTPSILYQGERFFCAPTNFLRSEHSDRGGRLKWCAADPSADGQDSSPSSDHCVCLCQQEQACGRAAEQLERGEPASMCCLCRPPEPPKVVCMYWTEVATGFCKASQTALSSLPRSSSINSLTKTLSLGASTFPNRHDDLTRPVLRYGDRFQSPHCTPAYPVLTLFKSLCWRPLVPRVFDLPLNA